MGKRLIQQARGKGGPTYRAPSHKYKGSAKHLSTMDSVEGTIMALTSCRGHSAPLALVEYENGEAAVTIAPEGVRIGDRVQAGDDSEIKTGNVISLKDIPEGTLIYNIESMPGDGGKFCRSGGTFARVITQTGNKVIVQLPSKKQSEFGENCRATIGVIAGGGRLDKPFLKAGKKYFAKKAKNKVWPVVSGSAMNAVDHPFGNKRTSRKSKARPIPRNAPPGRKVGAIAAKRMGRKKK